MGRRSQAPCAQTARGSVEDYLDWKRQAEDMAWFVASADGEDVGAGFAYVGWHSEPGTGTGEAFVLPDAPRHRASAPPSSSHIAGWVADRGCVVLETSVREDDEESLAWADRRGFREVGRNSRLVLDLTAIEAPAIDPPDGRRDHDVGRAPGSGRTPSTRSPARRTRTSPEARTGRSTRSRSGSRRTCRVTATCPRRRSSRSSTAQVVGYAKLVRSSSREGVALHDMTGVKRAFRGRGIAGALKRAEIAWAKGQGFEKLETSNEVRNEPIRRLNERHGYVVTPGEVVLREALAGPD